MIDRRVGQFFGEINGVDLFGVPGVRFEGLSFLCLPAETEMPFADACGGVALLSKQLGKGELVSFN